MTSKAPEGLTRDSSEAEVESVLSQIAKEKGQIESIARQAGNLKKRKDRAEARIEELREQVARWMEATGRKSLKVGIATVSMREGNRKLRILDEDAIPLKFWVETTTSKLQKDLIEAEIMTGHHVDGAELSNAEPVLSIKYS